MVGMFFWLRVLLCGMVAGLVGMIAGMAGIVYIYEFSSKTPEWLQAAVAFSELDELSFLVCFGSVAIFVLLYLKIELKRWLRRRSRLKSADSLLKN